MIARFPQTLRRADIVRLLNVSSERARQITHGGDFPPPGLTGPPRAWDRGEVETWIDQVQRWESKSWQKPNGQVVHSSMLL